MARKNKKSNSKRNRFISLTSEHNPVEWMIDAITESVLDAQANGVTLEEYNSTNHLLPSADFTVEAEVCGEKTKFPVTAEFDRNSDGEYVVRVSYFVSNGFTTSKQQAIVDNWFADCGEILVEAVMQYAKLAQEMCEEEGMEYLLSAA